MQRDKKGGGFTVQSARRLELPVGGSHPTFTSLVPSINTECEVIPEQRCKRCWKVFRVRRSTELFNYTCWRCSYSICRACRVPLPEGMDIWLCTLCVKPMNFMRLFESTACGVDLLVHIMTFCDPRAERIVKFLFPIVALQHVVRKDTTAARQAVKQPETLRRRQILVRAATVRSRAESLSGLQRRVLVDARPPQRMMRAKTAIKRYSPPQPQAKGEEHRLVLQGYGRCARTSDKVRDAAPLKLITFDVEPLGRGDFPVPLPFEASAPAAVLTTTTTPATKDTALYTDPHELQMVERNVVGEGVTNKFLRSGVSNSDGVRVDGHGISDIQLSPDSIVSDRSESPAPRFPSFSQFLDEQEAALHLEFYQLQQQQQQQHQKQQQQQSLNHQTISGCNSSSVAAVRFKCIEVVELDGRRSTWNSSPNPTPPASVPAKGMINSLHEPVNKSVLCSPAPQLRLTTGKTLQSISQRRFTADSRSPATTARTTITTARQSNVSTHALFQRKTERGAIDRSGGVSIRLHTSRGHLSRPDIPMKPITPRPFQTSLTTTAAMPRSVATGNGRGATDPVPTKLFQALAEEGRLRGRGAGITSPRFARKPTTNASLGESLNTPRTARAQPSPLTRTRTTHFGTTSKVTQPLSPRSGLNGSLSQKPKTSRGVKKFVPYSTPPTTAAAASARLPRTVTPLTRTNTSTRVRNVTPRGAGARTPLQRIASSRLFPSEDASRRYMPTGRLDVGPKGPPPPPLVVHFTRRRKPLESGDENESPVTARSAQQRGVFCHSSDKGAYTARPLPLEARKRNNIPA